MKRTFAFILVVLLLVSIGSSPAITQTGESAARIENFSYTGAGNVSLSETDLALWQSSSHEFEANVSSSTGVDGELCLDARMPGANETEELTCETVQISAGSTETTTLSMDSWPSELNGTQEVRIVIRTDDESTVLDSSTVSATVIEKDGDIDGDDPTNEREASIGTDLRDPDTDDDGLSDGDEIDTFGTSPTEADTDGDGLTDEEEVDQYETDPTAEDTDEDGLSDARELEFGTDPNHADTDNDGLEDGNEVNVHETDPTVADSDGDGLGDGVEVNEHGTNPLDPDTDGDGLTDNLEINTYETDPTKIDTDGDGLADGQ
ncbi:MAG: MarR family transcriptional regulator, partial [Halodesulfurarchaeum sp.]